MIIDHHQESPIHLGKFSRMRNHSISKTATAELVRARLACSSINTCAAAGPRPDLLQWARDRSQQPALLQTAAETTAGGALLPVLVEQLAKKT